MEELNLLKKALKKQSNLRKHGYWKDEIPGFCPPVLWFGDHRIRPKVVTVGANPSRSEFLNGRTGSYIKQGKRRFHHLETTNLDDVINDNSTLKKIVLSYAKYFEKTSNPYRQWFGKKRGGKVEGLVNGMGASLYTKKKIRAIHIDLMPFVTRTDFTKLSRFHLDRDLNQDDWASSFFNALVRFLQPLIMVVSGRRNVEYFSKHYSELSFTHQIVTNGHTTRYGITRYPHKSGESTLVGLNVNIGNPYGYSTSELNQIGEHILLKIK